MSATGHRLYRQDADEKFPSLYAVGRSSGGKGKKSKPEEPGSGTAGPPGASGGGGTTAGG